MDNFDVWLVLRDGVPVHARLTEEAAYACKVLEERVFEGKVEVLQGTDVHWVLDSYEEEE